MRNPAPLMYSPMVDRVLEEACGDFSEEDFAELALACIDQAMIPVGVQDKIAKLIEGATS